MDKEKSSSLKRRSLENAKTDNHPRKTLRSAKNEFNWQLLCIFCGCAKQKGDAVLHRVASGQEIKTKILQAVTRTNNVELQNRLELCGEFDLSSVGAGYHKNCYVNCVHEKKYRKVLKSASIPEQVLDSGVCDMNCDCNSNDNYGLQVSDNNNSESTKNVSFEDLSKRTLDLFKERFTNNEIIPLTEICSTFKKNYFEKYEKQCVARSNFIKSKIQLLANDYNIQFYSDPGLPDLVCQNNIPTHYLVRKIYSLMLENERKQNKIDSIQKEKTDLPTFNVNNAQLSEKLTLHKAANILRNNISEISTTKYYPTVDELKLEFSKQYVPFNLQLFISWLISEDAFLRAIDIPECETDNQKRMLTLSECIIFSSNCKKSNRIPPFHFGLTLQLHYKFGSKFLIDTLNACGFCATYDELRRFLTALAKEQISKNAEVYVPPKILNRSTGGSFIQEGADNVDICTETIDGKDTYHAMARVIFQTQDVNVKIKVNPVERIQAKSLEIENIPFLKMLFYKKPQKKPEPPKFLGATNKIKSILQNYPGVLRNYDISWTVLRSFSRGLFHEDITNLKQVFPNWVAFNTGFGEIKNTRTIFQYAPAIHAKPSDLNTVYTTLKKGQELSKECGQLFSVQTFDQQLYALAQFIKFDMSDEMENSIIRLGGFHTACTYIACIGKIWGDAGLRDLLADSGVYAGKTVDSMLEGKQFYRAIRGLTICYEVLVTLLLQNFISWMEINDKETDTFINDLNTKIQNLQQQYLKGIRNKEEFVQFVETISSSMTPKLSEFIKVGQKDSPTFQFWIECLQSIQILLDFIRAERDYNWDLHMTTHVRMLPFFFACNRPNYSRWGTFYVLDMLMHLPEEVEQEFKAGHFAINFTPGAFKGIFADMATETTVIKNTKDTEAGIPGLTRKAAAILRWTLTQNILGEYALEMRNRNNIKDTTNPYNSYIHEGEKPSLFHRDEEDTLRMLNYVKSHMTDPFSLEKITPNLINISNGCNASPEVSDSLLGAISNGTNKMFEFLERLERNNNKSFYDAITRNSLKTFGDMHKCTVYNINGKETRKVIKPETVFQRALVVSEMRPNVNLKMIMSLPLTNVPCIFFKPDGSRRTTPKSDLMHLLEKQLSDDVTFAKPCTQAYNCIIIIDGMAVLQALNTKNLVTFNDVGHQVMEKIIRKLYDADEIHLIFDRYDDSGINPKQGERFARYGIASQTVEIIGSRHVRDFKKILSSNQNKSNLTDFIGKYLQENLPCSEVMTRYVNKKVFIAGGIKPRENTHVISKNSQYADFNLVCNHMEADTRIIFHVNEIQLRQADNLQIIVESPDTDVFILLLSHYKYFDSIPSIWFSTGKTNTQIDCHRFIPIHELYKQIGPQISSALIVLHAMSGCDTVSSFFHIGKKTAYTAFAKLSDLDIDDLKNIVDLPEEKALAVVTKWLSVIYIPNKLKRKLNCENEISINNLRYKLACIKSISVDQLPPAEPALLQHIMRVKWQVNEWSQARFARIEFLDPTKYGWILNEKILDFNYFEGYTALEMLQKFICSCSGKSTCSKDEICSCLSQGFYCCDLCSCFIKCQNIEIQPDNMDEICNEIEIGN